MLVSPYYDRGGFRAVLVGGFVILVVGLIDDLWVLKPWQKLLGQVLSAVVVVSLGASISFVTDPFSGTVRLLGTIAIPLTILWVVSFENLINLSDGLDGLAAGVGLITALVMAFASVKAGRFAISPMAAALAGSLLGFLPFNFHPASIFMGDAGAMYIGLALAVLSVQGLVKSAVVMSVLAPILTLMVPIFDAAFAIVRRRLSGQFFAKADQDHLHHRLLELGMGQRQAVVAIYLVSLAFGVLGLVSAFAPVSRGGPIAGLAVLAVLGMAHKAGLLTITVRKDHKRQVHRGN
jgi:UDP-GlcNAc:undecaprenyl-phosphate GlcNAc-1-phosphate transferase